MPDYLLLPCAQPMASSVKRHYVAALMVLACALGYVNMTLPSPTPLSGHPSFVSDNHAKEKYAG